MIGHANQVTGFQLVMLDDDGPPDVKIMGWIRLLNGTKDAGYVYLSATPVAPRLTGNVDPYVVMSRQPSELAAILAFLGDGRPKTIRYSGQTVDGGAAFLEHDDSPEEASEEDEFRRGVLKLTAA